jgi:hypothetical protein
VRDLKGITVYVDGSREGQIINHLNDEEVRNLLRDKEKKSNSLNEEDVKCVGGSCDL